MAGRLRITQSIRHRELLYFFLIFLLFLSLMTRCKPAAPRKWTFPIGAQLNT